MKKTLLILLSLVLVHRGLGQKIYFTDTSNLWIVDYHQFDPGIDKKYDMFYHLLDTVHVGGKEYFKFRLYGSSPSFAPVALVREDTAEKKVYARNIYPTSDTSEHLLYNYSLAIGDTFTMYHPLDTFRHYVSFIDTFMINGIAHRRWYLNRITPGAINYQVVEGVGCMRDAFTPYYPMQPFGIGWHLKCFRNSHTGISTGNPSWYTTNCALGIDDLLYFAEVLNVYPNPARGEVNFTLPVSANKGIILTVYDITGRVVLQLIPQDGERKLTVNTSSWANGLYLVKLTMVNGSVKIAKVTIEN